MPYTPATTESTSQAAQLVSKTFFDKKCSILDPTREPNGAGGFLARYTVTIADVDCYLEEKRREPSESVSGAQQTSVTKWLVGLPSTTPISVTSRILIEGIYYDVLAHDRGKSFETEIVAECARLNDGRT